MACSQKKKKNNHKNNVVTHLIKTLKRVHFKNKILKKTKQTNQKTLLEGWRWEVTYEHVGYFHNLFQLPESESLLRSDVQEQ